MWATMARFMVDRPPIEILPWGRTEEQQRKIDKAKAQGSRGLKLFFLEIIALGLLIIFCAINAPFTLGP